MAQTTCPWDGWEKGTISFCEERLCAWVVEPSNAWSSWCYVFIGAWLIYRFKEPLLRQVAVASILIGLGSFAFHGTGTFVGEVIDLAGMLMLSGLMLAQAWGRAANLSHRAVLARWAIFTLGSVATILVIKPAGIPLFFFMSIAVIITEGFLWKRGVTGGEIKYLLASLGLTTTALGIWVTDISGVLCDPTNHFITGHAVWHVLNGVSIIMITFFYDAALRKQRAGASPSQPQPANA